MNPLSKNREILGDLISVCTQCELCVFLHSLVGVPICPCTSRTHLAFTSAHSTPSLPLPHSHCFQLCDFVRIGTVAVYRWSQHSTQFYPKSDFPSFRMFWHVLSYDCASLGFFNEVRQHRVLNLSLQTYYRTIRVCKQFPGGRSVPQCGSRHSCRVGDDVFMEFDNGTVQLESLISSACDTM